MAGMGAQVGRSVGANVGLLLGCGNEGDTVGMLEIVDPAVGSIVNVGLDVVGSSVGPRVGGGLGLCVRASHSVPKKHI